METVSEKIRRLFDYRGVCANSSNTNISIAKTSDYSPNNIRRVIISPDGVLVSFHKRLTAGRVSGSTNGNSQFAFLAFNALELNREEQSENYKPILLNLSEPRVCACVEEIVICTQSMNGVFDSGAFQREVSVGGMIKSFINKSGSIDDVVKRRFQRLRYFSLCSCTIQEVLMCCKDLNFLSDFISEHPQFSDRMQVKEYQSGEDYWKYANLQTSIYPFDANVLSKHFHEIKEKFEAFGWNVIMADAHDFESLESAFNAAKAVSGKPTVIIAKSVKGKGVSYMENNVNWHGAAPNDEQCAQALAELNA